MKKMTKALSLVLVLVIMICTFTACKKEDKGNQPAENGNPAGDVIVRSGYTRVDKDGNVSAEGNYIKFGAYPQSEVTDESLKRTLTDISGALPTNINPGSWTSYKYFMEGSDNDDFMWYRDVVYNGEQYRGVYFTSYRPSNTYDDSRRDDNGYVIGNVYWFKYEPIMWRILDEQGGKAFLLCEMLIDAQSYYRSKNIRVGDNNSKIYSNNYEHSDIRKWLNDSFYNAAFTINERELIELTEVDNSLESTTLTYNACLCPNTNDYVFLPSAKEVTTSFYGFSTEMGTDTARVKQTTDYAKCQGIDKLYTVTPSGYTYGYYCRLRSPYHDFSTIRNENYGTAIIQAEGIVEFDSYKSDVTSTDVGVAPAIWLKL